MSIDNSLEFPDLMVDIETTGKHYSKNAIIQLSAVKFNLETGAISHNFFDRCLLMNGGRYWDEDTRQWWSKRPQVIQNIWGRGEDPKTVVQDFFQWAGPGMRFWGKPTHFDFSFLMQYAIEMDLHLPFHYRYAENLNSWIRGRYWPHDPPKFEYDLPFEGDAHNAIHDCLHQIKVLFAVKEHTKNVVIV